MQVYGNAFTLPDRTVNFEDLQYRAYKIPIPTTIDMGQDHSVTVYADVRGDLRRAMLDWQAACLDPDITGGSYFEANRRPTKLGPDEGQTPSITVKLLAPDYETAIEKMDLNFPTQLVVSPRSPLTSSPSIGSSWLATPRLVSTTWTTPDTPFLVIHIRMVMATVPRTTQCHLQTTHDEWMSKATLMAA